MSIRKLIHDPMATIVEQQTQWTDVWKAQVGANDIKEKQYPFNFPAGFISIGRIQWEDMTLNVQEGNVLIDVYLFFNKFGDTFEGATDKEDSFADIDVVETIADELQWLEGSPFKELTLVIEEDLAERYNRPGWKLTFKTIVYKQVNQ